MREILLSFFTAIDARDWTTARQALSDTVVLGSPESGGGAARELSGDQLVELSRSTGGAFDWTSHNMIHVKEVADGLEFDLVAVHYLTIPSGDNWYTLVRGVNAGFDASGRINRLDTRWMKDTGNPALVEMVRSRK